MCRIAGAGRMMIRYHARRAPDTVLRNRFRNVAHAHVAIAARATDCNTERPHPAPDDRSPADDARALTTAIARPAVRMKAWRVGRLLTLWQPA